MAKVGVDYPAVVDLVTRRKHDTTLIVVEERALSQDDVLPLQEKLNNYLNFALDGELVERYPESKSDRVTIRVDLYASPDPFVIEFLRRFRDVATRYSVALEVNLNGASAL